MIQTKEYYRRRMLEAEQEAAELRKKESELAQQVEDLQKSFDQIKRDNLAIKMELIQVGNRFERSEDGLDRLSRFLTALESKWWWRWLGKPVISKLMKEEASGKGKL